MQHPIINDTFVVKKVDAKGGWHYVSLPGISENKDKLGQVRVKGTIDHYAIKQYNLLPMKNGNMLLPLKSDLRKAIRKKEGDTVEVCLYSDRSSVEIPDEILVCLLDYPNPHSFFLSLSDSNQKYYIDWILSSKKMETKVERIGKMIERLEQGRKFYDWPKKE
jgi:hypothetical protein